MRAALALAGSFVACLGLASDVVEVSPLTDRVLLIHFDDGYVVHHGKGQKRSDEKVVVDLLDTVAASRAGTYTIVSSDDPAYRTPVAPVGVARKSKGTDFAWFVDKWENGRAVNDRPDHAKEHWIALTLPNPLKEGKRYVVRTGGLAKNGTTWTLRFEARKSRAESVHANLLGYVPEAPVKFAYVYYWTGDVGGLDVKPLVGRTFWLVDQATGKPSFTGKVRWRMDGTAQETFHRSDSPPDGNFLKADVAECDFSSFARPGRYVVAVEGVGCSFPFRIHPDVYREAFRTVARGLYHNRSGIALTKPYTEFERPAPHNPKRTPGFAGKLVYTTSRSIDWNAENGGKERLEAGIKGPLDAWGWYQDAGDWDSYETHLRVAQELLIAYEIAPRNFRDGELNIPESGNGVPDILDEAAWLPRFCHRLRHELLAKKYGTGGIGLRVCGDDFGGDGEGVPSYLDVNRTWIVSGEDPASTYRYAGVAAQLAMALKIAKARDPEGVDWAREARESYAWARANTLPGDDPKVRVHRRYASAALFRLTGEQTYEDRFAADASDVTPTTKLVGDEAYGAFVFALGGGASETAKRFRAAVLHTARESGIVTPSKRALRWGGDFSFPMLVGQQTTPLVLDVAVGFALARKDDPDLARRLLGALYTTCDYFLGTNALNTTWVTGLGPRHPVHVFHLDAWYNGKGKPHPGVIPYGPWLKNRDQGVGPWDADWPNRTLYPPIDAWPGNERWYENRCAPMTNEFTIHQNTGPAAAIFGLLCAPGPG
ncbi:MAG: glycoside hydrolase family 9 protein [Fimbriimonadaceae bacterium]|nr:glycoside hydrolase family 9 protein [Fimbriimonadaceae bacterium]